jgi:hypothetical protein
MGHLRLASGRHLDDKTLATLLGELILGSDVFRPLWTGRDVQERTHGTKRFRHPMVGELVLNFENFEVCGDVRQRLVAFSAAPGSAARRPGSAGHVDVRPDFEFGGVGGIATPAVSTMIEHRRTLNRGVRSQASAAGCRVEPGPSCSGLS